MVGSKAFRGESALKAPFKLNELTVDPQCGTIAGHAGCVHVDPQVMAVLVLLVQHVGEVVSREELFAKVWPGRVVSDDALTRCIYQLRLHVSQAGGSDDHRALFETLPKRGYRLNLNESSARSNVSERAGSLPWKAFALAALAAGAAILGVVIWIAERPEQPQAPTADAQASDVYTRANDYYWRADRRTALPYAVELYEEAADLDPTFALALAGLARAHTDMYWHGIDRTPARLEKVESTLFRLFAMDPALPEAHLARANYLLKGLNQYENALNALEEAERLIPREPDLFFLRAMAYRRLGDWGAAIEALGKALEIDATNILYLRHQYINYQFIRDYERANQFLDRILELYPDDGTAYVDKVVLSLCRDGDIALFRSYFESAPSKYYDDGLAYTYTSWLAAVFDRDYDNALRILDDSTEDPIFDGDFRNASFGPKALFYARTHRLAGNTEVARKEYSEVVRLIENQTAASVRENDRVLAGRYLALAEAQAGLGQREEALDSVSHAQALIPTSEDALMGPALRLASVIRVLVPAEYEQEALRELDDYLGKEGHWSIEGLRADPRLRILRNKPGFKSLEEKYAQL